MAKNIKGKCKVTGMVKGENDKTAAEIRGKGSMEWHDLICQQVEIPINQLILILMLICWVLWHQDITSFNINVEIFFIEMDATHKPWLY